MDGTRFRDKMPDPLCLLGGKALCEDMSGCVCCASASADVFLSVSSHAHIFPSKQEDFILSQLRMCMMSRPVHSLIMKKYDWHIDGNWERRDRGSQSSRSWWADASSLKATDFLPIGKILFWGISICTFWYFKWWAQIWKLGNSLQRNNLKMSTFPNLYSQINTFLSKMRLQQRQTATCWCFRTQLKELYVLSVQGH